MKGAMKTTTTTLLLIFLSFDLSSAATPTDFIRTSCTATTYPDICTQSLTPYAPTIRRNPRQLAQTALTVSATEARKAFNYVNARLSTAKTVQQVRPSGAVGDCSRFMADSADRLQRSVVELGKLGRAGSPGFGLCMSNVQTWVSAALTDQNSCLQSLGEGGGRGDVKVGMIRKQVVGVSQMTSNALALVNRINGSKK